MQILGPFSRNFYPHLYNYFMIYVLKYCVSRSIEDLLITLEKNVDHFKTKKLAKLTNWQVGNQV